MTTPLPTSLAHPSTADAEAVIRYIDWLRQGLDNVSGLRAVATMQAGAASHGADMTMLGAVAAMIGAAAPAAHPAHTDATTTTPDGQNPLFELVNGFDPQERD